MVKTWIFILDIGERLRCNECNTLIRGSTKRSEDRPILYFEEAVLSDGVIGKAYCKQCAIKCGIVDA